jgi:hypothetical protein
LIVPQGEFLVQPFPFEPWIPKFSLSFRFLAIAKEVIERGSQIKNCLVARTLGYFV